MVRPDPAITWLLIHDPEALAAPSRDEYLRAHGIISATRAGEIREHEVPVGDLLSIAEVVERVHRRRVDDRR